MPLYMYNRMNIDTFILVLNGEKSRKKQLIQTNEKKLRVNQ
jgi:hypothetical protein